MQGKWQMLPNSAYLSYPHPVLHGDQHMQIPDIGSVCTHDDAPADPYERLWRVVTSLLASGRSVSFVASFGEAFVRMALF